MGYINIQKLSCNCKLRQPNETTYIPSHSTYTHPMMSHSHHPQRPRRLSTPAPLALALALALAAQAQEEEEELIPSHHQHHKTNSESSFSSSSSNFSLHKYSNPTPTLNKTSFGSKSDSSTVSNNPNKSTYSNNIPSGCFNVGSRGGGNWFGGKLFRLTTFSFMATQADISVHVPIPKSVRSRNKKLSGQQKKEELEREVSMLHKMLEQEEKVRKVLECVIYRPEGTPVHIPSFLPPKMKELLAELAMVEDEIGRLEKEVSHLQQGLTKEIEISKESEFKQWKLHEKRKDLHVKFTELHDPIKQTNKWAHERMPFEAKALHFISKAIKGDYVTLKGFNSNGKMNNSGGITTDQKENHVFDEVRFQEKSSNKSGIQKPAAFQRAASSSPRRPIRQQASKPIEVNTEMSYNLHPKSLLKPSPPAEDNIQKSSQPNKLSESIMKCLIFIFVRLMRTSRAMEIEKLSTVSRSTYPSVGSRRIRGDTGLNASIQKESKQQDPYGIFDIEDSIPRDIGPYKNLVRFTSSSLDPKGLSSSSSIPLLRKLRVLINKLQNVDLAFLTHQQKLAFWINMYNACIMHGFILYGVPSSSEKLLALMNKATLEIGGYKINALGIEHFVLRQSFSSNLKDVYSVKSEEYEKEAATYSIYRLESFEPNVTFALCCGTRSSPSVRIFTADGVSAELERSKLEYLQASIAVTSTKRLLIPELLLRKMLDFARDEDSLIKWICHQLPTSGSLRKQMVDCLRGHNSGKVSNIAEKMSYESEFQYLLAV